MFIRPVRQQNRGSERVYIYHQLIEAVRTPRGPRQRILLNLGTLEIPPEQWKELANRIETLFLGQPALTPLAPHLETLARHYAGLLRQQEFSRAAWEAGEAAQWETVDLTSLATGECRTLGGEAVALKAWDELDFPNILKDLCFETAQIHQVALLVIGRLLHPASERQTAVWAREISALGELLGADFRRLSNNILYRLADLLVARRGEIESRLAQQAKAMFSLEEKIILYDLTNTYLTGRGHENRLGQRGHSKEKRTDCPLLTLALVLDQDGEALLYCQSSARARKEAAMRTRMQQRFEEKLQKLAAGLKKPRGCKDYEKITMRLGRLRERYPSIARFYDIQVQHQEGQAQRLTWSIPEPEKLQGRFSGSYYLRSSRQELSGQELWSLYMMLNQVEEAFRALKSELGLRPVYHRLDRRLEGHLFITVLAYHLLAAIQRRLRRRGLSHRWQTIRTRLATQMRVTVSLTNDRGERLYLRQTTDPEPFHREVYRPLGLPPKPLKTKRLTA
jgi:hypothetical protein